MLFFSLIYVRGQPGKCRWRESEQARTRNAGVLSEGTRAGRGALRERKNKVTSMWKVLCVCVSVLSTGENPSKVRGAERFLGTANVVLIK